MTIFSSQSVALMPQTSEVADLVKYFAITDSTQNIAREMIQKGEIIARDDGKPTIVAIVAYEQTAGRGRLGRAWVSRVGRKLFSFIRNVAAEVNCYGRKSQWLAAYYCRACSS